MTQTASPYAHMSRPELISALEAHDRTLQAIYETIHLSNEKMAPGEKLFLIGARCVLANERPNGAGLVRLPLADVAGFIGMSESSSARYASAVIDRYGATKETVPYTTLKGQKRELTYVDRADPVWNEPWAIDLPEEKERTINGNGKYCERCKTYNLKVTTRRLTYQEVQECECCGYTKISAILEDEDNSPQQPGEYIKDGQGLYIQKGLQAGEPFVDEASVLAQEESSEICNPYDPGTPPLADFESLSSSQKGLQPEEPFLDCESGAAQLLLEIAGEHTSHIQMCKSGDNKYITVHEPLTIDNLRDHLHGRETKGVRKRSIEGETRAVWFDGDDPEEWQRCKEAAHLLAIVGFRPLLIPSPTQGKHKGGGQLWIIFDSPVDAYSAVQTVYQYTGGLLTAIDEYWPGGGVNARLPGGKYIYNCNAWCDLYDAHGHQLTHEGEGMAQVLLASQTPVELVNAYERPAPEPAPVQTKAAPPAGSVSGKDVARAVIDEFNATHSWLELLGTPQRNGKYLAPWRTEDRTANIHIYPNTDLAYDHSTNRWLDMPMDKYQVYCLIEGREGHELFRKRDLAERCEQYRQRSGPAQRPPLHSCAVCKVVADGFIDGRWLCARHYDEVKRYEDARRRAS